MKSIHFPADFLLSLFLVLLHQNFGCLFVRILAAVYGIMKVGPKARPKALINFHKYLTKIKKAFCHVFPLTVS